MKLKKLFIAALAALLFCFPVFTGCSKADYVIAIPNDATNEARALLLLEANGIITLKKGAGVNATVRDIKSNPYNIEFKEVEAQQIPNVLKDVDYAVINSNYALVAKLNPVTDSLLIESSSSQYVNVVAVRSADKGKPEIKALVAALRSQTVADFIADTYENAVISTVENPGDGYDDSIDYTALSGKTVKVGATAVPHCEILEKVKPILAQKGITLEVSEFQKYTQLNPALSDGSLDANFFQHKPYLDDYNTKAGKSLVAVCGVHVEPMGLYAGKLKSLDSLKKK